MKPITTLLGAASRTISHLTGRYRVIQRLPRATSRYQLPDFSIERNEELSSIANTVLSELPRADFLEIPVNCLDLSEQLENPDSLLLGALEDDLWENIIKGHPKGKLLNSFKAAQKHFASPTESPAESKELEELQQKLAKDLESKKAELKAKMTGSHLDKEASDEIAHLIAKKARKTLLGNRKILPHIEDIKEKVAFRVNIGTSSTRYKFNEYGNLEISKEDILDKPYTEIIDEGKSSGHSR